MRYVGTTGWCYWKRLKEEDHEKEGGFQNNTLILMLIAQEEDLCFKYRYALASLDFKLSVTETVSQ